MALELFGKLDDDGDLASSDHIFTGRSLDLLNISKWLNEQYLCNKRKKKVKALAEVFESASKQQPFFVRLDTKDAIEFHQALTVLSGTKKSPPLKKLVNRLNTSLCVY